MTVNWQILEVSETGKVALLFLLQPNAVIRSNQYSSAKPRTSLFILYKLISFHQYIQWHYKREDDD
jgi:hypothetical protein